MQSWSRNARRAVLGRAIPTARRSIRMRRSRSRRNSARYCSNPGHRMRYGWIWRQPSVLPVSPPGRSKARGQAGKPHRRHPSPGLGRYRPGTEGDANQLSPLCGNRMTGCRCHRGGAGPGSVLVDQRASAVAGIARPAGAGLPASPADPQFCRPEAVKSTLATGLRELRGAGATPADIRRLVGLAVSSSRLRRQPLCVTLCDQPAMLVRAGRGNHGVCITRPSVPSGR